jgi:hypothetical protein
VSKRKEPPVSKVPASASGLARHIFCRSAGHGKPPTMHRTTLQIYHSEKSLSFQIEALQWVLEGWIPLLLDFGSTSHAVQ